MDNIKKFESFLDRMQGLLDKAKKQGHIIVRVEDLENTFPELQEPEDERIRKALITFFQGFPYNNLENAGTNAKEALAWLEKQGEQKSFDYENANIQQKDFAPQEDAPRYSIGDVLCDKSCTTLNKDAQPNYEIVDIRNGLYICDKGYIPISYQDEYELVAKKIEQKHTDKVEPKFHEGDWVVHNKANFVFKVVSFGSNGYEVVNRENYKKTISFDNDVNYHRWTFQDAKDGDVLLFEGYYNSIVLFQGIGINGKGRINYHCKCDLGNYSFGVQGDVACLGTIEKDSEHYHPATKEHRELLFKKMHEAGYTFDFDKKELKKIEQKPTNEEMIETLRTEYEKGRADAIAEMQKGWSEEDEIRIKNILSVLDVQVCWDGATGKKGNPYQKEINWLKSLRPQNRWRPSEEQMKALHDLNLTGNLSYAGQGQVLIELYNDLKKLKGE